MYGEKNVDCEQCHYGASGGQTVVCCYYGAEECDPFGQCTQFELKNEEEMEIEELAHQDAEKLEGIDEVYETAVNLNEKLDRIIESQ